MSLNKKFPNSGNFVGMKPKNRLLIMATWKSLNFPIKINLWGQNKFAVLWGMCEIWEIGIRKATFNFENTFKRQKYETWMRSEVKILF